MRRTLAFLAIFACLGGTQRASGWHHRRVVAGYPVGVAPASVPVTGAAYVHHGRFQTAPMATTAGFLPNTLGGWLGLIQQVGSITGGSQTLQDLLNRLGGKGTTPQPSCTVDQATLTSLGAIEAKLTSIQGLMTQLKQQPTGEMIPPPRDSSPPRDSNPINPSPGPFSVMMKTMSAANQEAATQRLVLMKHMARHHETAAVHAAALKRLLDQQTQLNKKLEDQLQVLQNISKTLKEISSKLPEKKDGK